jgi:hypothetical protein
LSHTHLQTPEAIRVYPGSFWDEPIQSHLIDNVDTKLLASEKKALLDELKDLPSNAAARRVNELIKRAQAVKVSVYMITMYICTHMHSFTWKYMTWPVLVIRVVCR